MAEEDEQHDDDVVRHAIDQRTALEGEPVCVVSDQCPVQICY